MIITPIKTAKILPGSTDIFSLLDASLSSIDEGSVLAITSKVISLCENRVVPLGTKDKEELMVDESAYYLPAEHSKYGHRFTITNNTLIPSAGIDESNGSGHYVLWPKDPQKSANAIRQYLSERFSLKHIGVVITDSTCQSLRLGTAGIAIAHSGFNALNDYVGKPDLFGRLLGVTQSNIAGGLAAAAVLAMGEGAEQTPLCVIEKLPFVKFQERDPTPEELSSLRIPLEDDLFAPFLKSAPWQKGKKAR